MPEPVPPPSECVSWNPCNQSPSCLLFAASLASDWAFKYLQAIAALGLLADDVEDRVDQFCALSVVTLGPVVASAGLAEDEVVGPEQLAERTRSHRIHGARLEIDEHSTRNVLATAGLVIINVDAFQLQLRLAVVGAIGLDAVLVGDDLPELNSKFQIHGQAL